MQKILAIDDKQDNLTTLSALLKNLMPGCTVITAQSGMAGIEKAQRELPDSILLDIHMPEMDGFETCRRLKANERTRPIPVIMITAIKTDPQSRIKGLEIGADAFLAKPIDEVELVSQVKVALRIKKAEDALREARDSLEQVVEERTAALRASESYHRQILQTTADGFWALDTRGRVVDVNDAYCAMSGYSRDELLGFDVNDMDAEENPDETQARIERIIANGSEIFETTHRRKDGTVFPVEISVSFLKERSGQFVCFCRDLTQRMQAEEALRSIEWMLTPKATPADGGQTVHDEQDYGDVTELNRDGLILKSIGHERLKSFANDYLELLGTSSAIYEANGDYAFGIFASAWCRMMDCASRRLCETSDNAEALNSGRWLCHESCWTDCAKRAIAENAPVDIECNGGIRMYAVPILAHETVVGAMNFGYGDPPTDPEQLRKIAEAYHLDYDTLVGEANGYDSRPLFISELAKKRLHATARLIGSLIQSAQAEEALRASENRIQSIFRSAPIGIGVVVNRVLKGANPTLCAITGYSAEEMQDQSARMLYANDEEFEHVGRDKYAEIRKHGTGTGTVETLWQRKDGTVVNVLLSSTPIDLDDHSKGVTFTALDITERKRSEEALAHSHELMRHIIEHTSSGVAVHDRDLRYVYVSQKYLDEYGLKGDDIIGKHHYVVFPDLPEKWREVHRRALAGEVSRADRDPYTREDGMIEWTSWECRPWHESDGSIGGIIVYTEVITDRVRAEEALRESEERFRTLFESMSAGSCLDEVIYENGKAVDYRILDVNPAYEKIMGISRGDATNALGSKLYGTGEAPFLETLAEVAETGEPARFESFFEPIKKHLEFTVSRPAKGMFSTIFSDITERKQAEAEQEKLQVQLAQAQKMESVGRLAGGVAHDFNNMLGVILGHTEMALEQLDPAQPLFADLQEACTAAKRSADLTRQLLAFARKQTVAPKVLDLNKTVSNMIKMLRRLIGEDIDLTWLPGGNLEPVKIDPSQIDQILANLCVNARDAIKGVGKVTIETGAATFDEAYCAAHPEFVPGDYVMLAVSDNGCGMDAETLGHLFEPFFTTKELGRGTGLGLAMVYGVVRQNHGFVNVYSEPGQGTTFKIYLPRHLAKADRLAEKGPDHPDKRGHETILLVEDEPALLAMTTMMLERMGYAVIGAKTPGEAIRLANEHADTIQLLMTDVVMPEMNGRALAGNLLSVYPGIKRLFMSGYTANVIAHHGVLDEGVNFIQKPFSMKELAAKLREVLEE